MRAATAFSLFSLAIVTGVSARAQAQPVPRVAPERVPERSADEMMEADEEAGDPAPPVAHPITEGNIDYDVTYDNAVAQTYDDGYDPDAYAQFDETLSPYGNWIDDDTYGRVWQPSASEVGDDFSPYATGGRWAMTEYGWTWISDWDWGWAPFHYGRWTTLANRGWCWLPGTLWGPAWVSWRAGAGYVGWAPLPPRHVTIGSPLGARSSWRFAVATDLGRGRSATLPSRMVPAIFGRMTVVSNPRALPIPGSRVRVNAGPVLAGASAGGVGPSGVTRLASMAPRALPRRAIEPHPGTPAAIRPWVRTGGAFPDRAYGQRGPGSDPRTRMVPVQGPQGGPIQPRAFNPSAVPMNRRAPLIHAAPMTGYRAVPPINRGPGPVFRNAPAMAPHPSGGVPLRGPAPSLSGSGYSGGRSFGGRSFGGRSFGGGSSFSGGGGGGRSVGGGGGRSFGGGRSLRGR
jgi:hypothetical protein